MKLKQMPPYNLLHYSGKLFSLKDAAAKLQLTPKELMILVKYRLIRSRGGISRPKFTIDDLEAWVNKNPEKYLRSNFYFTRGSLNNIAF